MAKNVIRSLEQGGAWYDIKRVRHDPVTWDVVEGPTLLQTLQEDVAPAPTIGGRTDAWRYCHQVTAVADGNGGYNLYFHLIDPDSELQSQPDELFESGFVPDEDNTVNVRRNYWRDCFEIYFEEKTE